MSGHQDIDGRLLDHRVYLMARAIARVLYPKITDEELEKPAKRWNGTGLGDADCSVWQDHVPDAEAALAVLHDGGFIPIDGAKIKRLTSEAERVCHEEQLEVWASEITDALSVGDYFRDDLSYDDVLEISQTLRREVKDIVTTAFTMREDTHAD